MSAMLAAEIVIDPELEELEEDEGVDPAEVYEAYMAFEDDAAELEEPVKKAKRAKMPANHMERELSAEQIDRLRLVRANGACMGVENELFFPERGESTRTAKSVCRDCKVRPDCLEHAIDTAEKFGIWGGASERERRRIRRQRSQAKVNKVGRKPTSTLVKAADQAGLKKLNPLTEAGLVRVKQAAQVLELLKEGPWFDVSGHLVTAMAVQTGLSTSQLRGLLKSLEDRERIICVKKSSRCYEVRLSDQESLIEVARASVAAEQEWSKLLRQVNRVLRQAARQKQLEARKQERSARPKLASAVPMRDSKLSRRQIGIRSTRLRAMNLFDEAVELAGWLMDDGAIMDSQGLSLGQAAKLICSTTSEVRGLLELMELLGLVELDREGSLVYSIWLTKVGRWWLEQTVAPTENLARAYDLDARRVAV